MPRVPMYPIGELFTEEELTLAADIYAVTTGHRLNDRLSKEVVEPALGRIDEKTGQRNNASYLAYALEAALNQATRR